MEAFPGVSLKQIEAFYWISRLGSYSAAADRLNTTQPAISNRMRDFEQALGAALFMPGVRRPRLTARGKAVLGISEQFLSLGQGLRRAAGAEQTLGGLVRVGAADTVALTWLPKLLSHLGEQYPLIDVELFVDLSINLQARLSARELDIAFLVGPISDPSIVTRPLGEVRNAWMCAPALRAKLGTGPLSPKALARCPVITHSRGSHLHQATLQWFDEFGQRPQRLHGCNSLATMIRMACEGLGLAILPIDMVREQVRKKELVVLSQAGAVPSNRFLSAHQATAFDPTVDLIAEQAYEMARDSRIFRPTKEQ
jgi:DNA-binding transcriptional LysR family regulator